MALADYTQATATVQLADGNAITLRGLTLTDLAAVLRDHEADLAVAVELLRGQTFDRATVLAVAQHAVTLVPDLAAALIAHAADEPTQTDAARSLSAPVATIALLQIIRLTLDGGDITTLARDVMELAGGFVPAGGTAAPLEG